MSTRNKRIVLLFDGTWNDPEDATNVYRFARSLHDYDDSGTDQHFFYDPGVGTSRLTRFRGGVLGYGLSENLLQGYDHLARKYTAGDEVYVLGFSRGAYTARSLVGMIRKCGLLHVSTPALLKAAEKLYRDKEATPDGDACRRFRARYSREIRIHMIGVWDTVGALGIPGTILSERKLLKWHDTELSGIVDRAYHAVALDEHRAAYDCALWTGEQKSSQQVVEQRWFAGAHADVGGGYKDQALCDYPLAWMQEKALDAGLALTPCRPSADALQKPVNDSFKEFLHGAYSFFRRTFRRGDGRHYRRFNLGALDEPAVNVTVDPSVWDRWNAGDTYRPPTLTQANITPPGSATPAP